MRYKWVEVCVSNEQGITGVHYVRVSGTLVRPEQWAANQEREAGYEVLWARLWEGGKR